MTKYWIYRTKKAYINDEPVQAQLIKPIPKDLTKIYEGSSFSDPMQFDPYGVDLDLTFQINPDFPIMDNLYQGAGFRLYSQELIDIMNEFGVKSEVLPVKIVGLEGKVVTDFSHQLFHSLEGVQPAMDEEKSDWTGDFHTGVPKLVLDFSKFDNRPLLICNNIYVPLMRDDLKQAIEEKGITGFEFQDPADYKSGKFFSLTN